MEDKRSLGEYIAEHRRALGLTQRQFAERLYVTDSAVSKWERGLSYPDITLLHDICAVLGVTMLVIEKGAADPTFGYVQSLVNAFGSGIGFLVAMVLFAGVRERLETCDIPKTLRGLPITLIAASLVAVSFLGFQGLVDGLLG